MKYKQLENGKYKVGNLTLGKGHDRHNRAFYTITHPKRYPTFEEAKDLIKKIFLCYGMLVMVLKMDDEDVYDGWGEFEYGLTFYEYDFNCPICGKDITQESEAD